MTLVVETGAGLTNSNSYGSLAEADAYHAARGNSSWADTSTAIGVLLARSIPNGSSLTITYDSAISTYSFVSSLNPAFANEVLVGASATDTVSNLLAAINGTGTPGTQYSWGMIASEVVSASADNGVVTLTSKIKGEDGNTISLSISSSTSLFSVKSQMTGGTPDREIKLINAAAAMTAMFGELWVGCRKTESQAMDWPRLGVMGADGTYLDGVVPESVKQCQFELANQASPIVPSSDFSGSVKDEQLKIGPMEIKTSYTSKSDQPTYRLAVGLISRFILDVSVGRIIRG